MDEAERCHRLGYIAYGELLASGTPQQLVDRSGFITWQVTGHIEVLLAAISNHPSITLITRFGNSLHINGMDEGLLQQAIIPFLNHVITSYSIHYTKLYDVKGCSGKRSTSFRLSIR